MSDEREKENGSENNENESNTREDRTVRSTTAQGFLQEELSVRARKANPRLRSNLIGTLKVRIEDTREEFYFDWSADEFKQVTPIPETSDCKICLSGRNFMRIVRGELNPQIALLSDKIKLEGRPSLAIYFFNLLAP
jgi:putative sterol carrier protein